MVNKTILESDLAVDFELSFLDTGRGNAGQGKEGTMALINFVYLARQALRLLFVLIFNRPDIMHQSVTSGISFWKESFLMLLGRSFGVKVIAHIHGSALDDQFKIGGSINKKLMKIAFGIPHQIIVLSAYWSKFLYTEVSPALNVAVIPNCIDQTIAEAMQPRKPVSQEQSILVLYLGWLCVRKGILDALRAAESVCKEIPGIRFVFAGSVEPGPQAEMVNQACQEARAFGDISFPGMVMGDEKISLFSEASIFILPSYNENLPVAILEAMAMGLPVVSTAIAAVPELIQDGLNGFLIQPGDYRELADKIILLSNEPGLRQSMAEVNIARVRNNYHPTVFVNKIAQLYQKLRQNHIAENSVNTVQ